MTREPVFTIGHSNRSLAEFIDVLRSADIRLLIDVRRFPASRRHPQFNMGTLRDGLNAIGVAYRHFPELGGYRDNTEAQASSRNDGWPVGFLRNYADYAMTSAFQAALQRLSQVLVPRTAVMCAEKMWSDCHRQIIADYLIAQGHPVVHLVDASRREDGRLTPFARPDDNGAIVYPAVRAQLRLDL